MQGAWTGPPVVQKEALVCVSSAPVGSPTRRGTEQAEHAVDDERECCQQTGYIEDHSDARDTPTPIPLPFSFVQQPINVLLGR